VTGTEGVLAWPEIAIAAASLITSVICCIYTISRNRAGDITALRERITAIETKVDVFWRTVCMDAARILHRPDPRLARRDELIEKFLAETINRTELSEFIEILQRLIDDHDAAPGDRLAASIIFRSIESRYGL
jgi:hypothetical protein